MVAELGIGLDKTGVHFVGSSRIGLRCGLDSCKTASSQNSRLRSSVAPTRCLICTHSGAVFTSKKTLIFPQNLENKESEVAIISLTHLPPSATLASLWKTQSHSLKAC